MKMILRLAIFLTTVTAAAAAPVLVGSKKFTESYVLAEIAKQTLQNAGLQVEHRPGMGGTIVLWQALRGGAISMYPDYTGTIRAEILQGRGDASEAELRAALSAHGVGMTRPLGFNNTYAIVLRRDTAARLGVTAISQLKGHSRLRAGFTHEFLNRQDGWPPLRLRYQLDFADVRGIDHALGYAALEAGDIDIKDAYSTDARIARHNLVVLKDDAEFFPRYDAVFLYRLDTDPAVLAALRKLEGAIDETMMIRLNAEAELKKDYALAAALFFGQGQQREAAIARETTARRIVRWTGRHLALVGFSLALSILVGIPLGIRASRPGPVSQAILSVAGVVQTIPTLALLALLVSIPFLGIRPATAVVALFLYGLLPIIRNTAAGLQAIPEGLHESAAALGLEPKARLLKINLPLASRTILAGVKISAVINVGTATLAALIGAGGLGEPILSGLNLNDHATILQGAVPAALLALLVQGLFDLLDRVLIPRGLRL